MINKRGWGYLKRCMHEQVCEETAVISNMKSKPLQQPRLATLLSNIHISFCCSLRYIYIVTLPTSHPACPMPHLVGNLLLVRFIKPQSPFFHAQICLGTVPRKLNGIFGIWSFLHSTGLILSCPRFVCCLRFWNELYYLIVWG